MIFFNHQKHSQLEQYEIDSVNSVIQRLGGTLLNRSTTLLSLRRQQVLRGWFTWSCYSHLFSMLSWKQTLL